MPALDGKSRKGRDPASLEGDVTMWLPDNAGCIGFPRSNKAGSPKAHSGKPGQARRLKDAKKGR